MRWEYKVIDTKATGVPLAGGHDEPYAVRVKKGLDKLGKDGWELCGLLSSIFVFKRQTNRRK